MPLAGMSGNSTLLEGSVATPFIKNEHDLQINIDATIPRLRTMLESCRPMCMKT